MFDKLLRRFMADIIPKILPDLLREVADNIERGGGATIAPGRVEAIMDVRQGAITEAMAVAGREVVMDDTATVLNEWRQHYGKPL